MASADANSPPVGTTLPSEGDHIPPEGHKAPSKGYVPPPEGAGTLPQHNASASHSRTWREGETYEATEETPTPCTRSGRQVVRPNKYKHFATMAFGLLTSQLQAAITCDNDLNLHSISLFKAEINHLNALETNVDDNSHNLMDPRLLLATGTNNDNLHYGGAMAAPFVKTN